MTKQRKNTGKMKIASLQFAMKATMKPATQVAEYCSNIPSLFPVPS
jgi:hypothetical protein